MSMKKADAALARWTNERVPDSGYKFSITNRNDDALIRLKKVVKEHNANTFGDKLRVRLMGRGPRTIWARAEGKDPRAYDCYLPLNKATHFDVYVNSRD